MENNFEEGSASMPELEGVPVEDELFELHIPNDPMTDLSGPPFAKKPSSRNASFVITTPYVAGLNQFQPDEMVAPRFGPNTPFWENSLGQAIS